MAAIERQTTVNATQEEVFLYLSDVGKHADWAQHGLEVTRAGDGPIAVGSKWETVGHQFGAQPGTVILTELQPNERIVYESDGKVGHFRHAFTMQASDGGTLITKSMEPLEVRNLPLKVLGPVVRGFIAPKGLDGDLSRIKAKLEGT
jgi:uncharacterized protein YndB with AHSA1/START domain